MTIIDIVNDFIGNAAPSEFLQPTAFERPQLAYELHDSTRSGGVREMHCGKFWIDVKYLVILGKGATLRLSWLKKQKKSI